MRRLLAGDDRGFEGERFSLPVGARLRYPVERREVSLLVGSWSSKLTAFAGEAATELKVGQRKPRPRLGDARTGREPGGRPRVRRRDHHRRGRRTCASLARREVALYLPVVGHLDPTVTLEPELLERLRSEGERGAALISDGVLGRFAFAGTPAEVAEQAEAILDAGAARVDFGTPHGIDERKGVDLLCRSVLPGLDSPDVRLREAAPEAVRKHGRGRGRPPLPGSIRGPRVPDRARASIRTSARSPTPTIGSPGRSSGRARIRCSCSRGCSSHSTSGMSHRARSSSSPRPTMATRLSSASSAGSRSRAPSPSATACG